jgi:hypothetical protein
LGLGGLDVIPRMNWLTNIKLFWTSLQDW